MPQRLNIHARTLAYAKPQHYNNARERFGRVTDSVHSPRGETDNLFARRQRCPCTRVSFLDEVPIMHSERYVDTRWREKLCAPHIRQICALASALSNSTTQEKLCQLIALTREPRSDRVAERPADRHTRKLSKNPRACLLL